MIKKICLVLSRVLLLSFLFSPMSALPVDKSFLNAQQHHTLLKKEEVNGPYISYRINCPKISNKILNGNLKIIGNNRLKNDFILNILRNASKIPNIVVYNNGSFFTKSGTKIRDQQLIKNLLIINKLYVFSSKEDNYTIYIKENPYKSYIDFFLLDKNSHTVRETVNINRMPNSKNDHVNSIALMRLNNILSVRKTLKEMDESEDWYSEYWDSIQQKQEKPTESKLDRNKNLIMTQQVKNFIVKNAKTKMNADPNEVFLQRANIESILGNTYFNQVRVFFEGYLQKLDDTFDLIHSEFDEKINNSFYKNKTNNNPLEKFIQEKHELYKGELPLIKHILNTVQKAKATDENLGSPAWLSGEIASRDPINIHEVCRKIRSLLFDSGFWNTNGFIHVKRANDLLKVDVLYKPKNIVSFKNIIFTGNKNFSSRDLNKILQNQSSLSIFHNDISYSYLDLLLKLQKIKDFYINHGFTMVEFKVQFVGSVTEKTLDVIVHIHEGPYLSVSDLVLHSSDDGKQYKEKCSDVLLNTNIPWTANLLDTISEFNREINFNAKRTGSINSAIIPDTGFKYKNNYSRKIDCYQNEKNKELLSSVNILGQSPAIADYQIAYGHDKEFKTLPENYISDKRRADTHHVLSDISVDFCRSFSNHIPESSFSQKDSIKPYTKVFHLTEALNTGVDLRFGSNFDLFPQTKFSYEPEYDFLDEEFSLSQESPIDMQEEIEEFTEEFGPVPNSPIDVQEKKIQEGSEKYKTSYSLRLDADSLLGSGNPFFIESSVLAKGCSFTYGETSPNYLHNTLSQIDSRESTKFSVNFKHNFLTPHSMAVGRNWRTNFGEGNIWLENTAGVCYEPFSRKSTDLFSHSNNLGFYLPENSSFLWHSSFNYKTKPEYGDEFFFKNFAFNVKKSTFSGLDYSFSYNDIFSKPVNIFSTPLTFSRTIGVGYENKDVMDSSRVFKDDTFDFKCSNSDQNSVYMDRNPYSPDELFRSDESLHSESHFLDLRKIQNHLDNVSHNSIKLVSIKIKTQEKHKNRSLYVEKNNLFIRKPTLRKTINPERKSYNLKLDFCKNKQTLKVLYPFFTTKGDFLPIKNLSPEDQFSRHSVHFNNSEKNIFQTTQKNNYKLFSGNLVLFGDVGLSIPGERENIEIAPHYNNQNIGFYHNKFCNISQHLTHTSIDLVFGNRFNTLSSDQSAKFKNIEFSLKMDFFLHFLGYVIDASISDPLTFNGEGVNLKVILNSHPPKYNETYCYSSLLKFPKIKSKEIDKVVIKNGPFKSTENLDDDIRLLAEGNRNDAQNSLSELLPFDGDEREDREIGKDKDMALKLSDCHSKIYRDTIDNEIYQKDYYMNHKTLNLFWRINQKLSRLHNEINYTLYPTEDKNYWKMIFHWTNMDVSEFNDHIYDFFATQWVYHTGDLDNLTAKRFLFGIPPTNKTFQAEYDYAVDAICRPADMSDKIINYIKSVYEPREDDFEDNNTDDDNIQQNNTELDYVLRGLVENISSKKTEENK